MHSGGMESFIMAKLWGGRFSKSTDESVDDFNSSIRFDARMYAEDIEGSMAHAEMLGRQEIISKEDSDLIVKTLAEIKRDIDNGDVEFEIDAEDIHMNVEKILISRIGDVGKRLHTGRSRNDQVALDIRMYLRKQIDEIIQMTDELKNVILDIAEKNTATVMPGYTHMQKAQPITLAHYFMAYYQMLLRDGERLSQCRKRLNVMPLGSGALAATTYPLDREFVAQKLGFDGVTLNSLDGVSDRDFVCELAFVLSMLMTHLSRMSEEIILWSTNEFAFIELDDAYSTGSSIMPQKKNPDVAELVRGKSGRVFGSLIGLLTMMKGLPLAYNKDMQEDKEQIFDAVDTVKMCLPVFSKMLATMTVRKDNMLKGASGGFTNATDVADYLVRKGLPFRDAHSVVGKMVAYCIENEKAIDELSEAEMKDFSPLIDTDIYDAISLEACVNRRSIIGGPAEATVSSLIKNYKRN